jgi:hypothetical protein
VEAIPKLIFWKWFFEGLDDGKSGLKSFLNKWMILHIVIALFCLSLDNDTLAEIAKNAILPFAGALLGMTFAWSGNITALLRTEQISELSEYVSGGISIHVYKVQLSILTVLLTTIAWTLAAIGILTSGFWRFMLYFLSSIAIRECWQTILFAQYMTICRDHIAKRRNK